jgi:O-antigen ligase
MALLSPRAHTGLDFVTVVAFAAAPTVLGLTGLAAGIAYVLAGVHLLMTLVTDFSREGRRPIPFPHHGKVEVAVGIALMALPWIVGWRGTPRVFYIVAGVVILIVWAMTGYYGEGRRTG